jgi:shikimate kinase
VLNALATGTGSAFAIDRYVRATVELTDDGRFSGDVAEDPDADTALIERCAELVLAECGDGRERGAHVRTQSDIPLASGLKSSSAAANAAVLATIDALGVPEEKYDRLGAARLGVRAARDANVTVTGAFDDASASMLGGLTVTSNARDEVLLQDDPEWDVLVWTPDRRVFSAETDVTACQRVAPLADVAAELALDGRYGEAMSVNGLAYSAALGFPTDPAVEAMPHCVGVSLSGTGPSVVAVGERDRLEEFHDTWDSYEGETWFTTTQTEGAQRG